MTIQRRAEAITRAKHALQHLHEHRGTSLQRLGDARELLNRVHNWSDDQAVDDAVYGLECIVLEVYGTPPECPTCR